MGSRYRSYKDYLKNGKDEKDNHDKDNNHTRVLNKPDYRKKIKLTSPKKYSPRIIKHPHSKRTRSTRNHVRKDRDINVIEKNIAIEQSKKDPPKKDPPKKDPPNKDPPKKDPPEKDPPKKDPPVKKTPRSIQNQPRQERKKLHKRMTRRNNNRSRATRRGRKISVHKQSLQPSKIKEIEHKIQEIRRKNPEEIRKELQKEGIRVSGKSRRLLKDIYFYSKVCNINIKHES
jgi:hypothetical protein